ncbi:hypothetical protein, partial [Pyramidobacter piscolens]|uniref:hypothetical protein n=1 Tax=Pyramidobacter piscolens TaxID=638849 RepID=UPI002491560D
MTNRRDPVHRLYPYSSVGENYNRSFPSVKSEIETSFHCCGNSDSRFSRAHFSPTPRRDRRRFSRAIAYGISKPVGTSPKT